MCISRLFGPNKNCLSARSAHCTSWDHISWGLAVFGAVSRVQSRFFVPFMHDIQDCTSLNQPGIIRNFSQKKTSLLEMNVDTSYLQFFFLWRQNLDQLSLYILLELFTILNVQIILINSVFNKELIKIYSSCFCCLIHERYFCQDMQFCLDIWTI